MTVELGVLVSVIAAAIAVGTFLIGRMKDAEERGALKQRVTDLENRQDKMEAKIDKVLVKLDELAAQQHKQAHIEEVVQQIADDMKTMSEKLTALAAEHRIRGQR